MQFEVLGSISMVEAFAISGGIRELLIRGAWSRQAQNEDQALSGLDTMITIDQDTRFVLCINDSGCEDLEKSKVYPILPDSKAEQEGYLRVVDESGEDYLYPSTCFVILDIPLTARKALAMKSDSDAY
ncbi:MAG: hypothetical protein WCI66_01705 [Gammaproteobacteria bacterium]|jgi:hypothetical protein